MEPIEAVWTSDQVSFGTSPLELGLDPGLAGGIIYRTWPESTSGLLVRRRPGTSCQACCHHVPKMYGCIYPDCSSGSFSSEDSDWSGHTLTSDLSDLVSVSSVNHTDVSLFYQHNSINLLQLNIYKDLFLQEEPGPLSLQHAFIVITGVLLQYDDGYWLAVAPFWHRMAPRPQVPNVLDGVFQRGHSEVEASLRCNERGCTLIGHNSI